MNKAQILFFGKQRVVACDRQCNKAWGINSRPKVELSDNPDDYAFLSDGELGEAPAHPGTWEGNHIKPTSPDQFPNKWCVRECERCSIQEIGEPIELPSFVERVYNIERK